MRQLKNSKDIFSIYTTGEVDRVTQKAIDDANQYTDEQLKDLRKWAEQENSKKIDSAGNGAVTSLTVNQDLIVKNDLTVSGKLSVTGTTVNVNSTDLNIKDNVIVLNKEETGNGISKIYSGLQFDRGQAEDYFLLFDEADDKIKFGTQNSLKELATKEYTDAQNILIKNDLTSSVNSIKTNLANNINSIKTELDNKVESVKNNLANNVTSVKNSLTTDINTVNTNLTKAIDQIKIEATNASTSAVTSKLGRNGNTSIPMTFNWSGQSGQPSWLWGGNDGTNMYVYNPSNFNVNHATNAARATADANGNNIVNTYATKTELNNNTGSGAALQYAGNNACSHTIYLKAKNGTILSSISFNSRDTNTLCSSCSSCGSSGSCG